MSTPIVTARRNLAQRISNLLRKAEAGEINLTRWQVSEVQKAIGQLEEEHFAEGERTMSEAELPKLYEPAGFVADAPIDYRRLVEQLAAMIAAA
jgi:hypothetical protein